MICTVCKGIGSIEGFWLGTVKTCTTCHGSGVRQELSKEMDYRILERRISNLEKNTIRLAEAVEKIAKAISKNYEYQQFIK